MKKNKKFKPPERNGPLFPFVKLFLRPFYKKPKIIFCGEKKDGSVIVGNHCSMRGPVVYELCRIYTRYSCDNSELNRA